jgi:hypothetical protein
MTKYKNTAGLFTIGDKVIMMDCSAKSRDFSREMLHTERTVRRISEKEGYLTVNYKSHGNTTQYAWRFEHMLISPKDHLFVYGPRLI